jgi:hypothetical protein
VADIQTGRWGRLVQAAFNLKQALTLGQALPDVMPVFDITHVDESLRYHANEDYAGGSMTVPAVAAQYSQAILQLPANSGRIVVVDRVVVYCGTAPAGFQATLGGANAMVGAAPVSYTQFRDSRRGGRPSASVRTWSSVALGPNPTLLSASPVAFTPIVIEGPWVLSQTPVTGLPSPYLVIECNLVNTAFYASFAFRERTMEPAEYRV